VHYSAAKGAIVGLTKALAREKAASGIRVNAIAPGPIDTPLFRGAQPPESLDAAIAARVSIIPMGRLGRVDEVAGVIAFLLSDAASYMTGQIVSIDGGEIMG
jgi:NAD(P)-dependent dehydrogenase (short-subunit alcohol dehydrogenase family)